MHSTATFNYGMGLYPGCLSTYHSPFPSGILSGLLQEAPHIMQRSPGIRVPHSTSVTSPLDYSWTVDFNL